MVTIIEGNSVNELFIKIAREMLKQDNVQVRRGMKILEIDDCWLILKNPLRYYCDLKSRDMSRKYMRGEMDWYESGSLFVKDIEKFSSFWSNLADPNGTVNSNYGWLTKVEKHNGISQFEWCIKRLKEDKYTRQAIMNYNQPKHKYEGVKDLVCTISQQFIMRNEKLDSIVLMRSNDLIYGLTYDIIWFCGLLENLCDILDIEVGRYHHYAASLHVYERHFDMLEKMASEDLSNYEAVIDCKDCSNENKKGGGR